MDGTIYLDNDIFDGTLDFLNYIKSIGGRYIFLTNNSSKGVDKYIEKLEKMGVVATADDFLTSTDATILYLKERKCKTVKRCRPLCNYSKRRRDRLSLPF